MPGVAAIASTLASAVGGLDHGERQRAVVGLAQIIDRCGRALQRHGALRAPAALAERRIFRGRGELARIGGGIDHRRDDRLGAEVERARHEREIAERHAHHRRRAGVMQRADAGDDRGGVPQAVLASSTTAAKPSRAIVSATMGEASVHQAA